MTDDKLLNAGDLVYVHTADSSSISRQRISRVTKTQAIVQYAHYEEKFSRTTGLLIGGDVWRGVQVSIPTPALDAQYLKARIRKAEARLSDAAKAGDREGIVSAYEIWDRLSTVDGA